MLLGFSAAAGPIVGTYPPLTLSMICQDAEFYGGKHICKSTLLLALSAPVSPVPKIKLICMISPSLGPMQWFMPNLSFKLTHTA